MDESAVQFCVGAQITNDDVTEWFRQRSAKPLRLETADAGSNPVIVSKHHKAP